MEIGGGGGQGLRSLCGRRRKNTEEAVELWSRWW